MTRAQDIDSFTDAAAGVQRVFGAREKLDTNLDALREMAVLQLMYGQLENAEHCMKIALWVRPKDPKSMRIMAHVNARRGRALEAAKMLIAASDLRGTIVQLRDWREVGLALLSAKQTKLGARFLKKAASAAAPRQPIASR